MWPSLVRLGAQLSRLVQWPRTSASTEWTKALWVPPRGRWACPVLVRVRLTLAVSTGIRTLSTAIAGRIVGICMCVVTVPVIMEATC